MAIYSFCLAIEIFFITPCRVNEARIKMKKKTKTTVSRNKARYQRDGFDLDLTYITTRCIAMSLPAQNIESIYRNPIDEVARFFDTKHPDCYRIYNLCNERDYDPKYFHGNVVKYPIPDHNVPTLRIMFEFSIDSRMFLSQQPQNVIAVHCKGGKGRTGCMICSYLLISGICNTGNEALERFANKRTFGEIKNQGVSCPSQKRFIYYFEQFLVDLHSLKDNLDDELLLYKKENVDELFKSRYDKKEVLLKRVTIRHVFFICFIFLIYLVACN